jgi:hypothetical protein
MEVMGELIRCDDPEFARMRQLSGFEHFIMAT